MSTLALSGWGQPADALAPVCPADTVFFDYAAHPSVDACMAELGKCRADVAVGWSLGGQVLVRAVAAGIFKPKRLVLIAAPFQCAADAFFPLATPPAMLAASRAGFIANADAMLKQFSMFLALGDVKQQEVVRQLLGHAAPVAGENWLFWFDELVRFSCRSLDFSQFPPTDIIHGREDAVIRMAQGEAFQKAIPHAQMHVMAGCGHVPHWHDASFVRRVIKGE